MRTVQLVLAMLLLCGAAARAQEPVPRERSRYGFTGTLSGLWAMDSDGLPGWAIRLGVRKAVLGHDADHGGTVNVAGLLGLERGPGPFGWFAVTATARLEGALNRWSENVTVLVPVIYVYPLVGAGPAWSPAGFGGTVRAGFGFGWNAPAMCPGENMNCPGPGWEALILAALLMLNVESYWAVTRVGEQVHSAQWLSVGFGM
jgi:hypothetical protein